MILLLAVPVARAEPLPGQDAAAGQATQGTPRAATQQDSSPSDSAQGTTAQSPGVDVPSPSGTPAPGAEVAQSGEQSEPASDSQASGSQAIGSQIGQAQDQSGPAKPVGTAAAPAVKGTGVSGSRVSGAAIAPGKQRRVRTFLISVAVVVGACVAVGTVVALTHATPSQPR